MVRNCFKEFENIFKKIIFLGGSGDTGKKILTSIRMEVHEALAAMNETVDGENSREDLEDE